MSTCYKDFSVVIEYSNGTSGVIHGATVSIDEGIELQTMESLGAKGESSVFNSSITQGSLTVDGLLTESGVLLGMNMGHYNYREVTTRIYK